MIVLHLQHLSGDKQMKNMRLTDLPEDTILDNERIQKLLWKKIVIPNDDMLDKDACWTFTGSKDRLNCGRQYIGRDSRGKGVCARVPRLMYILANNMAIEEGMQINHHRFCKLGEGCCSIHHIYLGTQLQNMADRKAANNYLTVPKGSNHHNSKLTETDVLEMCRLYFIKGMSGNSLAKKYKVSHSIANKIFRGESWKHVTSFYLTQNPLKYHQKTQNKKDLIIKKYLDFHTCDKSNKETTAFIREIAKEYKFVAKYVREILVPARQLMEPDNKRIIAGLNRKRNK